ncbi:MAG: Sep-tRNA:Cys-tRNA synthetase [Methanothermococcus sp.]|uniref:O-phospho-L-seryl-tRNA:Cys-tRNA synthase n=1 Tax=Methanothermococcus sp. TaxID=2614238 RepID=UPI0025867A1E|nr:O-phospho-L-seryl-tRNA:Cys-tRNA synthase [Methanothermococcus sp.]MDK2790716.1 Sep-tRNA:Cys-tRNA synthetase [Methanothermococcus sp.]MDK2987524.1 Sep-tRNA:Cys-tRNA synthetase [Methanothermococcus sp.]
MNFNINIDKYRNLKRSMEREMINLNPIQRAGVLPIESKKAIYEFWDGYSVCDYCSGRLDKIETPPIHEFLEDLSKFLNMDVSRPTHGARESKFIVMNSVCKEGDYVVLDSNAHYTSYVAIERAKLNYQEVESEGYPTFRIDPEKYKETIDNLEDSGKNIGLILLTHVDGNYGNLADAEKIGKIAREKGYPFLLNCAYSVGRMPVDGKKLNADFIAASGHKSMAASGPAGILSINDEFADGILKTSKKFLVKELEMLGCTSRGLPILTLMTSFPHVVERVKKWDEEVKKTRYLVKELEEIGFIQLGVAPKEHDLVRFETPILDEIAQKDKRRGYFFYDELKKRKIGGIKRGTTKELKMSVYGLSWEQVEYVVDSIKEIVKSSL